MGRSVVVGSIIFLSIVSFALSIGVAAVKNACAPLRGIERADQGSHHACAAFNERVLDYVSTHPKLTLIILIGRWALLAEGSRAPGETGRNPVLTLANEEKDVPADNLALFDHGMTATVKRLHDLGRDVVLVEGIPEFGFDVPKRYLEAQFFGRSQSSGPTRAAFKTRNARLVGSGKGFARLWRAARQRRGCHVPISLQGVCGWKSSLPR